MVLQGFGIITSMQHIVVSARFQVTSAEALSRYITWMSRVPEVRIDGEGIRGLYHPNIPHLKVVCNPFTKH